MFRTLGHSIHIKVRSFPVLHASPILMSGYNYFFLNQYILLKTLLEMEADLETKTNLLTL
jgi:hypothetical protein